MTRKAVRRLRVVIDINVAFTGFSSASLESPPRDIIHAWLHAGLLDLIVSPKWLEEAENVFGRPRLQRWVNGRGPEWIRVLRVGGTHVADPSATPWHVPGDPDDDYLIALAVAADAIFVTGDKQIPDVQPRPPIAVMTAREFVNTLDALLARAAEGDAAAWS